MGFIERLRQQTEGAIRNQQQLEAQRVADEETKHQAQVQTWEREEVLHKQRKEQAEKFHNESGVGKLLYELGEAIRAEHHFDGNHEPWYIGSPHPGSKHSDNYWQSISWDERFIGETSESGIDRRSVSVYKKYSRKYIATEITPEGTIVVQGSNVLPIPQVHLGSFLLRKGLSGAQGSTTLPVEVWRNNPNVLEEALERSYNSPGNYTYTLTSFLPGIGNA